ncbi:hypothetical protein NQ318_020301 [Aromia moschata]|uniref:B30.2/SPRY domain-containing protein n=1 Tax=Aromia moschata TaxID=1265417 RepID=A0AAV8Z9K5_9CUCU|nr:hypothetical protein NQ318_020301 [Aromia moschata]
MSTPRSSHTAEASGGEAEEMGSDANPLRNGCDDLWTWDRKERSPEVRLYGSNFRIAHFHPNWSSGTAGVRGTRVLNNGRYFWELHLSRRIFGTSMMFGIVTSTQKCEYFTALETELRLRDGLEYVRLQRRCTKKARLHADSFTNLLGKDDQGWGLSHKGLLWHGGRWTHYTKPFRENVATKIGILFDGIAGTLTYYKDEKCLGVAFRGLNEIKEPLYPIICSTAAKTEMFLDSMKRGLRQPAGQMSRGHREEDQGQARLGEAVPTAEDQAVPQRGHRGHRGAVQARKPERIE